MNFNLIYIFPQSAWMPMFFRISSLSSVRQHIFLHPAGNVNPLTELNKFLSVNVQCNNYCFQTQAKQSYVNMRLEWMDSQVKKNPENELEQ